MNYEWCYKLFYCLPRLNEEQQCLLLLLVEACSPLLDFCYSWSFKYYKNSEAKMQAGDWEAFSGEAKVGILGVKSYWGDCIFFATIK